MTAIPEELLEQFERGNVLLFIGERIARDAAGRAVVDGLTAQLAARSGAADAGDLSFPEAAQAYEDGVDRQALVQFLRDRLEELGHEPQRAHRLIAGLTDCDVLATTCLDRRLERAFEAAGRPLDVIVGDVEVAFEREGRAQLYKLRGSVERPGSLVLTEDDYEDFFEDRASISVVLQGYLARKTVLFVGYDLADPHFKRLYRKVTVSLDGYARRAYAFGETPPARVCRWCERHGIQVVETDAAAFLEALGEQLRDRRAARIRPAPAAPPPAVEGPAAPLPQRPYKLLDYYEARDAGIFFGRRAETRRLTSLIHAHRLVLLFGASGTGKTSLLLAGVTPRLERADPPYETVYVRALEDPACVIRRAVRRKLRDLQSADQERQDRALAEALKSDAPRSTHHASLLTDDGSLVDFLHAAAAALGRPLVIVLDQFEEFFIRLSPEFREAFVAELGALYDARDVPVKVVLSLREDWLASVDEIEARIPEVYRVKMRLRPLTRDQARRAVTAPVERLGAGYEPALVERLLDNLTGAGETVLPPQLQLVCSALYDSLEPDECTITLAAYEGLGGARGVLRQYLDDELARLGPDERALARDALEELVTSERTKAVKTGDELALALGVGAVELAPVLEKLVRARLLRPVEQAMGAGAEPARAYELAHEYLIAQIALGPEAVARKEAEELLRQGVDNWRRFGALLSAEAFELIDAQRDRLRLDAEAQELMLRSALRHGRSVGHWMARVEDLVQALTLAEEVLLAPEGARARESLGAEADDLAPARLGALVGRLAGTWRRAKGTARAGASDALWALRAHLPRPLRMRLILYRSRTLLWRGALFAAGTAVVALVIGVVFWRPEILVFNAPSGPIPAGQPVTVSWKAVNAQSVELRFGNRGLDPSAAEFFQSPLFQSPLVWSEDQVDGLDPGEGSYTFEQGFESPVTLVLVASNMIDSMSISRTLTVIPRPEVEWVDVPAGEFQMGSNEGQKNERPVHPVSLDAFRISKYEITNAQYAQCVRATVCDEPEGLQAYSNPAYADHPVVYVSWFDAQDFCEWVGGRLPTEAQWEYAARGGHKSQGYLYAGSDNPDDVAWYSNNSVSDTHPVGRKAPNEVGLYDMSGNVWEWVADWYGGYPSEPQTNPTGPANGKYKLMRGGGFGYSPLYLRAAYRVNIQPGGRDDFIGFRCAAAGPGR